MRLYALVCLAALVTLVIGFVFWVALIPVSFRLLCYFSPQISLCV